MNRKFKVSNKGAEVSLLKLGSKIKVTRTKCGLSDTKFFDDMDDAEEAYKDWGND